MDAIRRFAKPHLRRPRALIAFEGWNDACESASGAVRHVLREHGVEEPFALIDPEEFYDFQVRRPTVAISGGGTRSLTWPSTRIYAVPLPDQDHDLVVVLGEEPSFRWRTFARTLNAILAETGVEQAVLLGAFIGQVAHTRPVPVIGVATDPDLIERHGLSTSRYEGPTGIVGVLHEACREEGLPTMSLWAAAPHYLAANANPKAMLALLEHALELLGSTVDTFGLRIAAEEFEQRVDTAMEDSDELTDYLADLEEDDDIIEPIDPATTAELVSEIESFLRNQE